MIAPISRFLVPCLILTALFVSEEITAQSADLEITSVVPGKTAVFTDETFQFTVRVRNHGPNAARLVSVAAGANALGLFRGITKPAGWTCDDSRPRFDYALVCSTATLEANATAEFVVTLGASQHTAMTYRVSARAATTTPDPVERNNRRETALQLQTSETHAQLELTAVDDTKGRARLEILNHGPDDARELTVIAGGAPLGASGSGWQCSAPGDSVACTRPALAAGETAVLTLRPKSPATPTVVVLSRVRAEKIYDEKGANNAAATTVVIPPSRSRRRSSRS